MYKKIIILILSLISLYGIYYYFAPEEFDNTKVSKIDFIKSLENAKTAYIIMDLRSGKFREAIMNCGVGLAGSPGLAGKEIKVFAFENNTCITEDGNKSINQCIRDAKQGVIFHIYYGYKTEFFKNRIKIGIHETNPICKVSSIS